jgi:putative endonuclease
MANKYNKKLGRWGEELAAKFLIDKGYKMLDKNYVNSTFGEIDLICETGDEVVFVEVKTRTSKSFGDGEEAVSYSKRLKINGAIERYMDETKTDLSPRFDVIVVELFSLTPRFVHYENQEI